MTEAWENVVSSLKKNLLINFQNLDHQKKNNKSHTLKNQNLIKQLLCWYDWYQKGVGFTSWQSTNFRAK